ncbi:hypothetical protein F3Y22_tig00000340pilonHSYRG01332 [Hibiscus syriacus]|uniref:Vps72/YL1 N-terminal domain-containing protein n=1 Tax=Hibiscus syriacus TaxID=106335 RepID=A0A6A3D937_HIBSY|nr:hypothetical protein F3Y22_tig00000340pilonHSYRG01332 [Hibiscus syriacus]
MTQEEMLLEAAQTEIMNLRNLERVLVRDEEVKKRAIIHKAVYSGPQSYSYLEFSKGLTFDSELSTTLPPCKLVDSEVGVSALKDSIANEELIYLAGVRRVGINPTTLDKGLGRKENARVVRNVVINRKPSVLFLQETRVELVRPSMLRKLGGKNLSGFAVSSSEGASGGILSLWDENWFISQVYQISFRFVAIKGMIKKSKEECCFLNVYGPTIESEKEAFFEELLSFIGTMDCPLCEGGSSLSMVNLALAGGSFTWCNNREVHSFVRVDRLLVNDNFLLLFSDIVQVLLPKSISDHNAVALEISQVNWGLKPFKLFNYPMDEVRFQDMLEVKIKKVNRGKRRGIESILKELKEVIKSWSNNNRMQLPRMIENLEKSISERETEIQGNTLALMESIARELWSLYKKDEQIWFQKSRPKWIQDSDRNSRYFYQYASNRERVSALKDLEVNGNLVSDPEQIKSSILEYFKKAYNLKPTLEVEHMDLHFYRLSKEQCFVLERSFSEDEIWEAIASSDNNKVPGPDGLNMGFFKRFWPLLKEDILKFFKDFYSEKKLGKGVNHSFITLIPKKTNLVGIEEYRPISLVGGLYKILSKVLSRRLRVCKDSLIGPLQFAFVPGIQICDCSFIANGGIDYWRIISIVL